MIQVTIHYTGCGVGSVRNFLYLRPHQSLGIIEQVFNCFPQDVQAEPIYERDKSFCPDTAGGDLGFHVTHYQVGDADVVPDQLPHGAVTDTPVFHFYGLEL